MHACMHAYIHTYICTCTHTHMYTWPHIHIEIRTYPLVEEGRFTVVTIWYKVGSELDKGVHLTLLQGRFSVRINEV